MIFAAEQLRDLIDFAVLLSLPGVLVLAWLVGRLLGVLVSPPVADELSHLQDHVAPTPPDGVRELVEEELGSPVDEVFAEFDRQPLAAASIGQAHRARLHGGQQVVVKVQRPGIADSVNRDLDVLNQLATVVRDVDDEELMRMGPLLRRLPRRHDGVN